MLAILAAMVVAAGLMLALRGGDDGQTDDSGDAGPLRRWGAAGVVHTGYPLPDWPQHTPGPTATPTPAPTATPVSGHADVADPAGGGGETTAAAPERAPEGAVTDAIRQVFGSTAGAALAVAYCETGGTFDPQAVGHLGERGLFQIHPMHAGHWPDYWDNWDDPRRNAEMAYDLSAGGTDWGHWSCKP